MIINDLDLGLSHPWPVPQQGQVLGTALIEGSRTIVWPRGAQVIKQNILTWVTAWQALGGQAAMTLGAARYLLKQLEELASTPDLQPVYIQWTNSAASGAFSRADEHDGWYTIDAVEPDYTKFIGAGIVECRMSVSFVAPAAPSSLATYFSGAALSSTYSATAVQLIGAPIGASSGNGGSSLTRVGGEGTIPLTVSPLPNPVPFVRPGTIAGLFQGGLRVFDTVVAGGNAVPTNGTFTNANWVQVYGTMHDFAGDCIVTNGLLLLLYQVGQQAFPTAYLWNTSLSPAAWQQFAVIVQLDNAVNAGTVREVNLDRIGLEEVRTRVRGNTAVGQWEQFREKLGRGAYHFPTEVTPLTQDSTSLASFELSATQGLKIIYTEAGVVDTVIQTNVTLPATSTLGFVAGFGTAANSPLVGILFQNAPTNQGQSTGVSNILYPSDSGPTRGNARLYGIFAVPFVTIQNLQAEGESGTLGTGWSSVADAAASGGNAAKVASGTLTGNADLFGTSYVPTAGQYSNGFRMKVTSTASTTAQLQAGLWDVTSAAFVAGASTIWAPSQLSTGYVWVLCNRRTVTDGVTNGTTTVTSATAIFSSVDAGKAISGVGIPAGTTISSVSNATTIILSAAATTSASGVTLVIGGPITPTAAHNMQFRAVTSGTLATDFFVDEAALLPIQSATLGVGNFPGDIWAQFAFPLTARWARG